MVSIDNIYLSFGGFDLFRGISFLINPRDRIGLVGRNGAGKSTLLKLITGEFQPSQGKINKPSGLTLGYLPQQLVCTDSRIVWEEALSAFEEMYTMKHRMAEIDLQLQHLNHETHHDEIIRLAGELHELNDAFLLHDGGRMEEKTEKVLLGLGFERSDFVRKTSEFSGGWRMRIELAKLLLKKPDLFLLDEPTNHLDIEAIQWLEDFLSEYSGAVLLISHDKAFLDRITNRTVEISLGQAYDYKVPYSAYVELRKERREQQISAYRNQQKMIDDTEKFIERFRYKSTKSVQVQSRIKQLEKIDRIEIDEEDNSAMNLRFPPSPHAGSVIFEIRGLTKSYGSHVVLYNLDLTISRGDKIALVGRNGEGKTTFARILMNQLEYKGDVKQGYQVKTGYFAQNQDELLDKSKTVFQTIDDVAVGEVRTKVRSLLGSFMFSGEDVDKKVSVLSGGECSRLSMAKLLLEPVNFLILDEPTNHLDIRSKEILKEALRRYDGTLLLVSHDREFLDGLVNRIWEVRNKKVKEYDGDIWRFLEKKKIENLHELEIAAGTALHHDFAEKKDVRKQKFAEKKEYDRQKRKLESAVKSCENEIHALENKIQDMELIINNQEELIKIAANADFFAAYESVKKEMVVKMSEWEVKVSELDQFLIE